MKIVLVSLGILLLLSGCGAQPVMETVADEWQVPVMAEPKQIWVELPEDAAMQTFGAQDGSKLYVCGELTVCLQTLPAGDLDRTLRAATGQGKEQVALMQWGNACECAWTAAGEGGMQVGRTRILERDGYHYAVSVMAPENSRQQETIRSILDSMVLVEPDFQINTGS